MRRILIIVFLFLSVFISIRVEAKPTLMHVIIVSIDGLRSDAITTLIKKGHSHFESLIKSGVSTLNARTDPDSTVTMPNHIGMITGRFQKGQHGHHYTDNSSAELLILDQYKNHIPSIFDIVHQHGLRTGFFASKLKFRVFINSYGRPPSSITYASITDYDDRKTMNQFLEIINRDFPALSFVHLSSTDQVGHQLGWDIHDGSPYMDEVKRQDQFLGEIINAIVRDPMKLESTILIVTTDHGGIGRNHSEVDRSENYRIPLIIWGKGVAQGDDLYRINALLRSDPGQRQISLRDEKQPIRNRDVANLALSILGLPLIEGETLKPLRIYDRK